MDALYRSIDRLYENNQAQAQSNNLWEKHNRQDKRYAEKTYADLIEAEYQDYLTRYKPAQEQYVDLATSTELLDEQLSRISIRGDKAFDLANASKKLTLGRYGVTESAEQTDQYQKQNQLSSALSMAQQKNSARVHHGDRQMAMMTGASLPSVRTDINAGARSSQAVQRG